MHSCASLACALLILTVALPASAGGRKTDRHPGALLVLRGDLLEAGELDAPFADPGSAVGRFVLRSSGHGDLRIDPGVARLSVRGGALRARAADPSEDRGGFIDLCALGMTPFPCPATLPFRPEPTPLPPIPLVPLHTDPSGLQAVLTDQQQALLGCGSFYGTVCDGTEAHGIYLPPYGVLNQDVQLTSEQQALLGCGPYYGTVCDGTVAFLPGVRSGGNGSFGRRDFVWVGGAGPDGFVYSRNVDPITGRPRSTLIEPFAWLDPEGGFQSEMATLSWNAVMALVALSQSDGMPSGGEFDPTEPYRTDGCSFNRPFLCSNMQSVFQVAGVQRNPLSAAGNGRFGRRDFVWTGGDDPDGFVYSRNVDPITGRPRIGTSVEPFGWLDPEGRFQSEMAVLSWNALMLLVAQSQSDGVPSEGELDTTDPFRTDGCSFANPFACTNGGGFLDSSGWRFTELEGDPRGGERLHWLWESAIAYDIVHARGELSAFRDGRLYVYGPFESPIEGSASGVGLLLVPPEGAVPAVSSPMMRVVPGLDRMLGTADDSVVGFVWGAAGLGFDGVSEPRPQARGRAFGHSRRIKAGAGRSSSKAGRQRGRP
jgi:hypothetical protein